MNINRTAAVYAGAYVAGQIGGIVVGTTIAKKTFAYRDKKRNERVLRELWPHLMPTRRSMLDR